MYTLQFEWLGSNPNSATKQLCAWTRDFIFFVPMTSFIKWEHFKSNYYSQMPTHSVATKACSGSLCKYFAQSLAQSKSNVCSCSCSLHYYFKGVDSVLKQMEIEKTLIEKLTPKFQKWNQTQIDNEKRKHVQQREYMQGRKQKMSMACQGCRKYQGNWGLKKRKIRLKDLMKLLSISFRLNSEGYYTRNNIEWFFFYFFIFLGSAKMWSQLWPREMTQSPPPKKKV